jgi:hypothetical protein
MQRGFCLRSMAIGSGCLMFALVAGVCTGPGRAQAQQFNGSGELYPQWLVGNAYMPMGFAAGPEFAAGTSQQAYTAKLGSGIVGLFVESNNGARLNGVSGNFFGTSSAFPTSQREDWFSNLGNPAWRTSVFGSYKSDLSAGLFNGLYTTASFGLSDIKTNLPGFSGLTNFSSNDLVGITASAGVGLQLTPNISIEGGVSWTQVPNSTFR